MTDVRSATKIVTALCDSLAGFINDLRIYIYTANRIRLTMLTAGWFCMKTT